MSKAKIAAIVDDVDFVKNVFFEFLNILPSFEIANSDILPFGLRPHTRSVSWIVEQVITQQTKKNGLELGLTGVEFHMPDTSLHNCIIHVDNKKYYINIKIHDMAKRHSESDIAAVEKLFKNYKEIPDYNIIYACFGIHFEGNSIRFDPEYLKLFSPQFMPIYINPRNDKLQALYHHDPEYRTRRNFLDLLVRGSTSIALKG
ncbi:hypothetical protein [Janthinobacterium sp. ROICE36]|uniref:hypothetical protein n=1 Tax=Janthinobacterium sp. ROICE36 TaxID=2048670 RepID=UPI0011AFB25E|nr:hypothetical protein [Janthinobacterium sp. ROICE36]